MHYVALLRGIGPGNPNMHNDRLRSVFESLGFSHVQSVISSGNVLLESGRTDKAKMETEAEAAFPKLLGFSCITVIRSQAQLEKLAFMDPFKDLVHGPTSYLLATFFKHPTEVGFRLPYQPPGKPYRLLAATDSVLFTTTDTTAMKTTDLMTWLEKQYGKDITSRTWLTVQRILKKMKE